MRRQTEDCPKSVHSFRTGSHGRPNCEEDDWRCPRCHMTNGNDWSQCGMRCPLPVSPHYDERLAAAMDYPIPHQMIHV